MSGKRERHHLEFSSLEVAKRGADLSAFLAARQALHSSGVSDFENAMQDAVALRVQILVTMHHFQIKPQAAAHLDKIAAEMAAAIIKGAESQFEAEAAKKESEA